MILWGDVSMDEVKKEVGEIIDRLATIFEEEDREDEEIMEEINTLGERLKALTGKTIEEIGQYEYLIVLPY